MPFCKLQTSCSFNQAISLPLEKLCWTLDESHGKAWMHMYALIFTILLSDNHIYDAYDWFYRKNTSINIFDIRCEAKFSKGLEMFKCTWAKCLLSNSASSVKPRNISENKKVNTICLFKLIESIDWIAFVSSWINVFDAFSLHMLGRVLALTTNF